MGNPFSVEEHVLGNSRDTSFISVQHRDDEIDGGATYLVVVLTHAAQHLLIRIDIEKGQADVLGYAKLARDKPLSKPQVLSDDDFGPVLIDPLG
jgi:hypothetical protein